MLTNVNTLILLASISVIFVLLIIFICISISNSIKLKKIMQNCKSGNLAQTITEYYDKLEQTAGDIKSLSSEFARYEKDNQNALQHIGIEKFNAFDDIRGDLSFSAAILNRHADGFIITSLYGHETSNVYIRKVHRGQSDTHLLDEEKTALQIALNTEV